MQVSIEDAVLEVHTSARSSRKFRYRGAHAPFERIATTLPLAAKVWTAVASALLPEGFPASVTPDYLQYQIWDTIQALSSYVRGMISQEAILRGVGVGSREASALSAVTSFFIRDLTAMAAGILFTHLQGSNLDAYAKQWRLMADCLNNVGMALELISPLFPQAFLLLASAGAIARAITGVAGGATRTALTQHFSHGGRGSPGDISAKEGSQEALTTLLGMLLGMLLLQVSAHVHWMSWSSFLFLTFLHMFANIRALRALQMRSLNPYRLLMLIDAHIRSSSAAVADADLDDSWQHVSPAHEKSADCATSAPSAPSIPSPTAIGAAEPLLIPELLRYLPTHPLPGVEVNLGTNLECFLSDPTTLRLPQQHLQAEGEQHVSTSTTAQSCGAWEAMVEALQKDGFCVVCCPGDGATACGRVCFNVVVGLDCANLFACITAALWGVAWSHDLELRSSSVACTKLRTFVTNATHGKQASGGSCVGVILPAIECVEVKHPKLGAPWQKLSVDSLISQLSLHGWECSNLHWKCGCTVSLSHNAKSKLV